MNGDRETNIDKDNCNELVERDCGDDTISKNVSANIENGNYNERIGGDYVGTKLSANTINIYHRPEENYDSGNSKSPKSSSLPEQPKKKDATDKLNNQDYYINRPPIEDNCFQEIEQAGALLRINASEKMGKSLLLKKIFEEGAKKNYAQVRIDLQQLQAASLSDYSTFLRYLCKRITRKLKLKSCLEDYFEGFTLNIGCSDYFEEYILESLDTPLILGIDNIDRLFASEFKIIANDFFGLLRSWHENRASSWEKLRLIVIYSTEDLPKLNIHQSPFNVGTKIELADFEEEQILELALRYGLDWSINEAQQLKEMVGGHPYLVHHAIKSLNMYPKLTLPELLKNAATDAGIYADHLQHHCSTLEQEPTIAKQLKNIVKSKEPIAIAPNYLYKLDSMGLITKVGNQVKPRCQIYRDYFRERLLTLYDS